MYKIITKIAPKSILVSKGKVQLMLLVNSNLSVGKTVA